MKQRSMKRATVYLLYLKCYSYMDRAIKRNVSNSPAFVKIQLSLYWTALSCFSLFLNHLVSINLEIFGILFANELYFSCGWMEGDALNPFQFSYHYYCNACESSMKLCEFFLVDFFLYKHFPNIELFTNSNRDKKTNTVHLWYHRIHNS